MNWLCKSNPLPMRRSWTSSSSTPHARKCGTFATPIGEEYERTHRHRVPRQVYETTLTQVVAFETKYGLSSEQFLQDFEAGIIDEDPTDWVAFYRWRTMAYGLQHMEKEYGFQREAKASGI
ncbi:hypothetical protein [Candidatus Amarolinea dominans]|uniref:hypothetical protein n=1 Tax=Candidatus Amarolinea dominans TaxID=3140696 RepID=UPI0031376631|nr:hypothetical protein [Anaerolineae bacterium]